MHFTDERLSERLIFDVDFDSLAAQTIIISNMRRRLCMHSTHMYTWSGTTPHIHLFKHLRHLFLFPLFLSFIFAHNVVCPDKFQTANVPYVAVGVNTYVPSPNTVCNETPEFLFCLMCHGVVTRKKVTQVNVVPAFRLLHWEKRMRLDQFGYVFDMSTRIIIIT